MDEVLDGIGDAWDKVVNVTLQAGNVFQGIFMLVQSANSCVADKLMANKGKLLLAIGADISGTLGASTTTLIVAALSQCGLQDPNFQAEIQQRFQDIVDGKKPMPLKLPAFLAKDKPAPSSGGGSKPGGSMATTGQRAPMGGPDMLRKLQVGDHEYRWTEGMGGQTLFGFPPIGIESCVTDRQGANGGWDFCRDGFYGRTDEERQEFALFGLTPTEIYKLNKGLRDWLAALPVEERWDRYQQEMRVRLAQLGIDPDDESTWRGGQGLPASGTGNTGYTPTKVKKDKAKGGWWKENWPWVAGAVLGLVVVSGTVYVVARK